RSAQGADARVSPDGGGGQSEAPGGRGRILGRVSRRDEEAMTKRAAKGGGALHLVVFEDSRWRQLRPLTDLLPVPALRLGASDLLTRWRERTGLPLAGIEARRTTLAAWRDAPPLEPAAANSGAEALVLNAAALPGPWLDEAMGSGGPAL